MGMTEGKDEEGKERESAKRWKINPPQSNLVYVWFLLLTSAAAQSRYLLTYIF